MYFILRSNFLPTGGTFCGIGEVAIRSDAHLIPVFRRAGLNHKDDNQAAILIAGIGGGIGSAASVLVEKVRQLNPLCHVLALVVAQERTNRFTSSQCLLRTIPFTPA